MKKMYKEVLNRRSDSINNDHFQVPLNFLGRMFGIWYCWGKMGNAGSPPPWLAESWHFANSLKQSLSFILSLYIHFTLPLISYQAHKSHKTESDKKNVKNKKKSPFFFTQRVKGYAIFILQRSIPLNTIKFL